LYHKYGFKINSEFMTTYNKINVLANKMEIAGLRLTS